MIKGIQIVPIALTLLLGIVFQALLIVPDMHDTPSKAVIEFASAYYKVDPTMEKRLCEKQKASNGPNWVERYIYQKRRDAAERGLSMFYLREKLYDVRTETLEQNGKSAQIRLTASAKAPLKSFFTKEKAHPIDNVYTVVNENGGWKVCSQNYHP